MLWFKAASLILLLLFKLFTHILIPSYHKLSSANIVTSKRAEITTTPTPITTNYINNNSSNNITSMESLREFHLLELLFSPTTRAGSGRGAKFDELIDQINNNNHSLEDPPEDCDGFDNIIDDIGMLTYLLDCGVTIAGLLLLIPVFIAQVYSYISAYKIAFPSLLIYLLDENDESVNPFEELIDNIGIMDTMFNILINLPLNDLVNLVAGIIETVGAMNLFVENFSAYPDWMDFVWRNMLGIGAEEYFEDYGCNPYHE